LSSPSAILGNSRLSNYYEFNYSNPLAYRDQDGQKPTTGLPYNPPRLQDGTPPVLSPLPFFHINTSHDRPLVNADWGLYIGLGSVFGKITTYLGAMALSSARSEDQALFAVVALMGGGRGGGGRGGGGGGTPNTGGSGGPGASTTFYHGTNQAAAVNIVENGLQAVSTNTFPYPPGSYFTHAASEPLALEAASHWGLRSAANSLDVRVVAMTVPNTALRTIRPL
jgi:hypothetical protein